MNRCRLGRLTSGFPTFPLIVTGEFLVGAPGVEGLHDSTKCNGLAESGAVLDPRIICKNLGDCPTDHAGRHLVRDEGVAGSNPATPTSFLTAQMACGERYGERNPNPACFYYVTCPDQQGQKKAALLRMGIGPAAELGRRPS
jgi:hypothetical protein